MFRKLFNDIQSFESKPYGNHIRLESTRRIEEKAKMSLTPKNKVHSSSSLLAGSTSLASTAHHLHLHGHHQQVSAGGSNSSLASDTIQLLVDNANFVVNPEIFSLEKDTMLYRMFFSSPSIAKPNDKGQYVIEGFSATVFGAILVRFFFCLFIWSFK